MYTKRRQLFHKRWLFKQNSEGKLTCNTNSHLCSSEAPECANEEKRCSADAVSMKFVLMKRWEASNCESMKCVARKLCCNVY